MRDELGCQEDLKIRRTHFELRPYTSPRIWVIRSNSSRIY